MTKIKKVKLDSLLIKIFQKDSFDCFTVVELRDLYLRESKEELCPSETRKFIYKQILRLMNLGLLNKKGIKNSQNSTYEKSNVFSKFALEANKKVADLTAPKYIPVLKSDDANQSTFTKLEKLLNEYQVDMMSSISESEEYVRLCEILPDLKPQLKNKYHQARDRSSQLLGQIKAIKTAISIQSNSI